MGFGSRYFLFEQDGTIKHIPKRVVDGLYRREDRLLECAGQTVRVAVAELVVEDRRPIRTHQVFGEIWKFDQLGRFDEEFRHAEQRNMVDSFDFGTTPGGDNTVVDITPRIAGRELLEKYRWEPTPTEITRVVHAIWPETAGRPIKRPKTISGVRKRRPPMTLEAKRTISKCREDVWSVVSRLDDLSEPSLKAVIGKIEGLAEKNDDLGAPEIWEGIRAAAVKILAVHKARRSNKGKWFAVVERAIWRPGASTTGRVDVLDHVRCNGRKAAITKCREFLRKYADQFDENTSIDVQMYPEIEWLALPYSKDLEPE